MEKRPKVWVVLLVAVALAVVALFIWLGHRGPKPIRMAYMEVSTGLPLFVALERGMFRDEGLEVEATGFDSVNQAMDALMAGRVDIVQGVGFTTFIAIEQNTPDQFKMFWTCADTQSRSTNALLKRKGAPLARIEDLKGHKLGTYAGTTQMINAKVILRKVGLAVDKDVEIVQVARHIEVQALAAGQFDALFTIEPDVTIALEKGVAETLVENPRVKYIYDPFVAGGAVASTRFVTDHPQDMEKILRAANRAIDYIREHEEEAKRLLARYTPLSEELSVRSGLYEFWKLGEENRAAMQGLADLYYNEGELKKRIDVSSMLYEPRSKP